MNINNLINRLEFFQKKFSGHKEPKCLNVALIASEYSTESEASLLWAKDINDCFNKNLYNLLPVIITKNKNWLFPKYDEGNQSEFFLKRALGTLDENTTEISSADALGYLKKRGVDVAFLTTFGALGEDGTLQGFLEMGGVPYTGSGVKASALAMDKVKSLQLFKLAGLSVPEFINFTKDDWQSHGEKVANDIEAKIGVPLIIKPVDQGSSVGISILHNINGLKQAVDEALRASKNIMAQKFIKGDEVICAIINGGSETNLIVREPVKIVKPRETFFTYKDKKSPIMQSINDAVSRDTIKETALMAYKLLECEGMARVDMIVDDSKKIFVLEINTLPLITTQVRMMDESGKISKLDLREAISDTIDILIKAVLAKK